MPKAPTAQHTLDAVAPVQDCARRNRFHHHRSSLPHCFLSDYIMGNGACWYNDLHHIPTMLAYLPSALYTKCTDMSSVGLPGRKMVLFYCSEASPPRSAAHLPEMPHGHAGTRAKPRQREKKPRRSRTSS